jgi:hypothetical protein
MPGSNSKIMEDKVLRTKIKEFVKKEEKEIMEKEREKERERMQNEKRHRREGSHTRRRTKEEEDNNCSPKYRVQRSVTINYESKMFEGANIKQSHNATQMGMQDILIENSHIIYRQEKICYTLGGMPIELITLSAPKYCHN